MDAIRVVGKTDPLSKDIPIKIDQNSATVIRSIPHKVDEIEFFMFSDDEKYKNKINSSGEHIWLGKDLGYYEEYKTIINSKKVKWEKIKNHITNRIANMEPKAKGISTLKNLNTLFGKIISYDLLSKDDQALLSSPEVKDTIKPQDFSPIDELLQFYGRIKLNRPNVIFRQPMENAFKKEKIRYSWIELEQSDSLLSKMIMGFADDEALKTLNDIFRLQGQEDDNKRRIKNRLIDSLNNQVKTYFDNDLSILKGHPKFSSEGSEIVLDIEPNSKISLEVDDGNEDSRSLGFKSFVRIVLEMKMLSKVKDDVIYLIDEPEQGLHPFLQEVLIRELKKIIDSKDSGLTILIASHSPYIVKFKDDEHEKYLENLNFVLRNSIQNGELKSGETIVKKLNDEKFFIDMLQKWSNSCLSNDLEYLDEEVFLYRMIIDVKILGNYNKTIKTKIGDLNRKFSKGEIDRKKFDEEIKKISLLKETFKSKETI